MKTLIPGDRVSMKDDQTKVGTVVSVNEGVVSTYVRVQWPGDFKGGRRLPGTFSNTYAERLVRLNEEDLGTVA